MSFDFSAAADEEMGSEGHHHDHDAHDDDRLSSLKEATAASNADFDSFFDYGNMMGMDGGGGNGAGGQEDSFFGL